MTKPLTPDLCIIGAGSAGLSVAVVAGGLGVPAILVEKGAMGGECLNAGCVPSKALLAAAHAVQSARVSAPFGLPGSRAKVDHERVHAHVQEVIASIAPNDSVQRYQALGVQVVQGEARFVDRRTVAVGDVSIRARRFILATGSRPAVPPIPGLADAPYLTNETIFDLTSRPEHLIVLGAGPVGLELGQAHRRLGAAVTIVDAGVALGRVDREITEHLLTQFRAEGITLVERTPVTAVEAWAGGIRVMLGDGRRLDGTHLLVASGRRPVTEGLGLEAAGIKADATGIVVDRGLRTTNRRVYAIGDCAGGPHVTDRLTHVASHHAGLVVRNALFRLPVRVDAAPIPRVVYTDPELATVGLTEEEAKARHRGVRVLRFPFSENDRAQAERQVAGEAKIVVTAKGSILGAAIVGARAGELIVPWTLALQKGMSIADFRDLVVPYPTFSEVSKRAAVAFYASQARRPAVGRLLRFLRLFG